MTNKEALEILDTIPTIGEQVDALEMAIKALEQQPCDEIHGSTYGGASWSGTYTSKEQQTCEDCISREDAIKAIQNDYEESKADNASIGCLTGLANAAFLIHQLPSIKPQPTFYPPCEDCNTKMDEVRRAYDRCRWIPVSERLPEDGQDVLICDIDGDIMIGYHVRGRLATHFSQQGSYEHIKNVKAWQPLPEPYKAEPQESEDEGNAE